MAAKAAVSAVAGALLGVVAAALAAAVVLPWLAARGDAVLLSGTQLARIFAGAVACSAGFAVLGLGLGALIRHQAGAVVAALAWMAFVDMSVEAVSPRAAAYLPAGAEGDVLGRPLASGGPVLALWLGAVLLAGYASAALALGTWRPAPRRYL